MENQSAPPQPNVLAWEDVHVRTKRTKKAEAFEIVKGVDGFVVGGTALGIMGPSGCGKTTLLNVLSTGKHAANTTITANITWNGNPLQKSAMGKLIGYVHQQDALLGVFTVRELFTFSARLRLPFSAGRSGIKARVDRVIRQLHLDVVADRKVGDEKVRGLSGGERRRVSIGVELVTSPQVLILDEPTSGLDSHIAKAVVNTLIEVAHENLICVAFTIHQPSSSMFRQLDNLMLMVKGHVVYFGSPLQSLAHFDSVSPLYKCPELTNPAEHILDIVTNSINDAASVTDEEPSNTEAQQLAVAGLVDAWKKHTTTSNHSKLLLEQLQERAKQCHTKAVSRRESSVISVTGTAGQSMRGVPFWFELWIVLAREWKNFVRDPYYFVTQLATNLMVSVFVGLMYWDSDDAAQRANALYFALLNVCFVPYMSVMVRFPLARKVFNREKEAGYYSTASFFWAYFFVDVPMQLVMTFSFSIPVYWMVGFYNDGNHFLLFNVWLYLMYQVCQSLGLACTAAFPTVTGSMAVGSLMLIIFMSFGGFFLDLDSIPVWFNWISYISMFRYAFEGLVVTELRDRSGGEEFFKAMGMKDQLPIDAMALLLMILVFRLFIFVNLRFFKGNTNL